MPDNQSPEKYALLAMLGAEVHQVPVVPYSNPNQYQHVAKRLAASLPNAIWSNQFDNTANRDAHARTTGPEIWEDRKSTRLNSSHLGISYAVFCLKKKKKHQCERTAAAGPH